MSKYVNPFTDIGFKLFNDKLRFIYLQLPCFTKEPDECENDFERWIYVLKNMETLNRMPWAAQNSVFQRLAEIAEVSAMTKEERMEYDGALKRYRDTLNVMRGVEQKGRVEGRAEGRAEGRSEVVKTMRAKGYSDEDIMMITGISPEELESI